MVFKKRHTKTYRFITRRINKRNVSAFWLKKRISTYANKIFKAIDSQDIPRVNRLFGFIGSIIECIDTRSHAYYLAVIRHQILEYVLVRYPYIEFIYMLTISMKSLNATKNISLYLCTIRPYLNTWSLMKECLEKFGYKSKYFSICSSDTSNDTISNDINDLNNDTTPNDIFNIDAITNYVKAYPSLAKQLEKILNMALITNINDFIEFINTSFADANDEQQFKLSRPLTFLHETFLTEYNKPLLINLVISSIICDEDYYSQRINFSKIYVSTVNDFNDSLNESLRTKTPNYLIKPVLKYDSLNEPLTFYFNKYIIKEIPYRNNLVPLQSQNILHDHSTPRHYYFKLEFMKPYLMYGDFIRYVLKYVRLNSYSYNVVRYGANIYLELVSEIISVSRSVSSNRMSLNVSTNVSTNTTAKASPKTPRPQTPIPFNHLMYLSLTPNEQLSLIGSLLTYVVLTSSSYNITSEHIILLNNSFTLIPSFTITMTYASNNSIYLFSDKLPQTLKQEYKNSFKKYRKHISSILHTLNKSILRCSCLTIRSKQHMLKTINVIRSGKFHICH